ncbi:RNA polymerase I-specific transcription initiation factor rrn3 [Thecamonas trahens ATCC 50062]|uniref:RNA polymerase I-specific transcription initiation factor rrn3 n=1 Tax=Thecamonas trahens ATCC 50062 TaxID=461836 RepID=A0A0L0DAW6_THETB|nr:RNA polymerase I-specific transcription initiation factor rrn3 [Thecamonas trahens ATCC 50062]KNC49231.1 RNA polymerase I-specific transcription initiation factor rrn3 [Thecamonas trahens ATCC 50062]|eukprot:XP_013757949.1 RNA polymerase I-specific transcription initiation factor rrn3 [Thecamonas trahens ATCC 50062]
MSAETLDMLMHLLFQYLDSLLGGRPSGNGDGDENTVASPIPPETTQHQQATADSVFVLLMHVFEASILQTHQLQHTQFLIFYVTSQSRRFQEAFLSYLLETSTKVEASGAPSSLAQVAAAYLGSYLARAKFLELDLVLTVMESMALWLHQYVDAAAAPTRVVSRMSYTPSRARSAASSPTLGSPQMTAAATVAASAEKLNRAVARLPRSPSGSVSLGTCILRSATFAEASGHSRFYAMAQSLLYAICFHLGALSQNEEFMTRVQGLALDRIVSSWLNPLRYTSAGIVGQFARMAYDAQLAYCYDIIHENKRLDLISQQQDVQAGTSPAEGASSAEDLRARKAAILKPYFPFDPYPLPLTAPLFENIYNEWVPLPETATPSSRTRSRRASPDSPAVGAGDAVALAATGAEIPSRKRKSPDHSAPPHPTAVVAGAAKVLSALQPIMDISPVATSSTSRLGLAAMHKTPASVGVAASVFSSLSALNTGGTDASPGPVRKKQRPLRVPVMFE